MKYRDAVALYGSTRLSCQEICRIYGVTPSGLRSHISRYHRNLMLARYDVACDVEMARHISMGQRLEPLPVARIKYRDAVEACCSMEFIEFNLSQIARMFSLNGSGLARQLRMHYSEIIEFREQNRLRLGIDDRLPRGMRAVCKAQYAEAVKRLRTSRHITMQEAADICGVSYAGLEQHLLFYHKRLVEKRIGIRKQAVRCQRRGEITSRGTRHAPSPAIRESSLPIASVATEFGLQPEAFRLYLKEHESELHARQGMVKTDGGGMVLRRSMEKDAEAIRRFDTTDESLKSLAERFGVNEYSLRQFIQRHFPKLIERHRNKPNYDARPTDKLDIAL